MSDSNRKFNFGATFDRDDPRDPDFDLSQIANECPNESALSDICDICHGYTENIIFHLRNRHPEIYQHMIEM